MFIIELTSDISSFFENLTFPNYAHLLNNFDATNYIAIGALTEDNLPIGLILVGNSNINNAPHEILSIYVDDDYRNQHVATQMLTHLVTHLYENNLSRIKADYPDDLPDIDALEKAFINSGFAQSSFQILTVRGSIRTGMTLVPDIIDLPDGVLFRDWVEKTTDHEEQIMAYVHNYETTGAHYPFYQFGIPIHDATSVLLCYDDRIIGWMVNHEVEANAVRYSRLFIAPDWRKQRLGIRCFFEAMRRHYAYNPDSDAIFAVNSQNTPMLAVVEYFKSHPDAHFSKVKRMFWHNE